MCGKINSTTIKRGNTRDELEEIAREYGFDDLEQMLAYFSLGEDDLIGKWFNYIVLVPYPRVFIYDKEP